MESFDLIMPKMGESIMEATILSWSKKEGDIVELDETILEIATDKVDSEIPSPVAGKVTKILFQKDAVVPVGTVIALIEVNSDATDHISQPQINQPQINHGDKMEQFTSEPASHNVEKIDNIDDQEQTSTKFYSPLVKSIAAQENITYTELDEIVGKGQNGRVTKNDLLQYIESKVEKKHTHSSSETTQNSCAPKAKVEEPSNKSMPATSLQGDVEIIEMDRMRKLIADHMVMSKHTSPHVTSFVEADVTKIVQWRDKIKDAFQQKNKQKITFTPIFIEALTKAIKDYPLINSSIDGNTIIKKNNINIGMAAALPSGNLIVPVIKNADRLNLIGLTSAVNDLSARARANQLKPDEIQGGTFTLTNVGTFGNVMGTPIINQPQVAILAVGAIKKKPAVIETPEGDVIAIRHMMFLSLSYDHRVVDGMLGGSFLRRIADYLEAFNVDTNI